MAIGERGYTFPASPMAYLFAPSSCTREQELSPGGLSGTLAPHSVSFSVASHVAAGSTSPTTSSTTGWTDGEGNRSVKIVALLKPSIADKNGVLNTEHISITDTHFINRLFHQTIAPKKMRQ